MVRYDLHLKSKYRDFLREKIPGFSVDPISGRISEIGSEYVHMTTHKNGGKGTRWEHKRQPEGEISVAVPQPKQVQKLKDDGHQCDGMFYRIYVDTPDKEAIGDKYRFTNLPTNY